MSEERQRVLNMLEQGTITAGEAEELLSTLERGEAPGSGPRKSWRGKFLRIIIKSSAGDDIKVNLPLSLAEVAMKLIPHEAWEEMEKQNIDLDTILAAIEADMEGEIVNINSSNGDDIRIFID